jgi:GntR family transcriptional regulator/MocR family aminotransferase
VRSARRTYAQRSALVLARLGSLGTIEGSPAGMYVTLQLSPDQSRRAAAAARAAGFDVPLLAEYSRTSDRHGLVLGIGGCTEAQLTTVLDVLGRALDQGVPAKG